jgi:hypothetical protein
MRAATTLAITAQPKETRRCSIEPSNAEPHVQQFYDADGKLVLKDMGATHATRISLELTRVSEGKATARSTRAFC